MVSRYTCPFYWKLLQQVTRIGLPFASAAGASALACKQPNLEKRDQKRFNKDHISCIDHSQLTWKARHFSLLVSRAWKSGLCSRRGFSCLHETSATTFTQDLNWNCVTICLSPWTHQYIRNLASQVLAIRFALLCICLPQTKAPPAVVRCCQFDASAAGVSCGVSAFAFRREQDWRIPKRYDDNSGRTVLKTC